MQRDGEVQPTVRQLRGYNPISTPPCAMGGRKDDPGILYAIATADPRCGAQQRWRAHTIAKVSLPTPMAHTLCLYVKLLVVHFALPWHWAIE